MRILSPRRADVGPAPAVVPAVAPIRASSGVGARLGTLLVQAGSLSALQAEQVAQTQGRAGQRFGEAAVALGFVTQEAIDHALAQQFDFSIANSAESRLDPALVTARGLQDRQSELIRSLRAKLWQELDGSDPARRAVTAVSLTGKVGRRVILANLAIAFAQSGVRTLLIDADLRAPALHRLFDAPNQAGLSTFLAGRQPRPTIIPIAEIDGLAFHPAGPVPPNPGELLSRLGAQLETLRDIWHAELVLLNTTPLDASDDAYLVAGAAPSALLVTRRHFTRTKPLIAAQRRFAAEGVRIIGSVINVA